VPEAQIHAWPPLTRVPLTQAEWVRDTDGRVALHPGVRSAMVDAGLGTLGALLRASGELVSRHRRTEVVRLELEVDGRRRGVYLKRHLQAHRKDAWRSLLATGQRLSAARVEWRNMDRLAAAGVETAIPVALGERLAGLVTREPSVLCTLALDDHTPLPELLPRLGADERRRVLQLVAATVARLHDGRLSHPDLYARHLYIDTTLSRCVLLDVQRTRRHRRQHWRWRHRDLAALDVSVPAALIGDRERLRFICHYGQSPSRARWLAQAARRRRLVLETRGRGP
jgi:hypothetical protein